MFVHLFTHNDRLSLKVDVVDAHHLMGREAMNNKRQVCQCKDSWLWHWIISEALSGTHIIIITIMAISFAIDSYT